MFNDVSGIGYTRSLKII